MKITGIECIPVQAPGRTLVPVLVHTDAGITGLGEAGLQRRWRAIQGAVEHLAKWLIGQDARRIEYLWQKMFRGGFYPADRLIGSAISAIDIALWDIKAKALGVPLYELLGGRCRDHVQCFLSTGYKPSDRPRANGADQRPDVNDCFRSMTTASGSPDATVERARAAVSAGHRYFRIGPDADGNAFDSRKAIRRLIAQLRAVREALGDQVELMVDLHGRLDAEEAIWFCNSVEDLDLFLVEDPIRSEHAAGYRRIRPHVRVPLAAGEQWANKWEFRQAIEEELIDFARIDICIAGGLTEAKKIAAMAETHLIKILPHNPLGPVCTAASLHLDIACDNIGPQEVLFPPEKMLPDVFQCDFKLEGTRMSIPTTAGLGVVFNAAAAAVHAPEMTEPPHFVREDGSYSNY